MGIDKKTAPLALAIALSTRPAFASPETDSDPARRHTPPAERPRSVGSSEPTGAQPSEDGEHARWPWSVELYLGGGTSSGAPANPSAGVEGPSSFGGLALGVSLCYVHFGAGFELIGFEDHAPLMQEVSRVGGGDETLSSSASAPAGYAEVGLNYGFQIPIDSTQFIELLPLVSYGAYGVGPLTREVGESCVGCVSEDVPGDYQGGDFLGLALGTMWGGGDRFHGSFGLTPTYRHFLHPGDARLRSQFLVSLTIHVGGGT